MEDTELKYWVAFTLIPGIGRVRLGQLERCFGTLEVAWNSSLAHLTKSGLDSGSLKSVMEGRPGIDPDLELQKMRRFGVSAFTYRDDGYPKRLKETYDYPPVLYVQGSIEPEDEICLAVVGTRVPSPYGRQVTEEMVEGLTRSGVTVVSGLARGVDTVAHRAALDSGGRTIAILASGLDTIYPGENSNLAKRIAGNGALVSEYPIGIKPRPDNFPRRNRIMSGMSLGTLVIEAGDESGSLITAKMAVDENREVFAVPGSIFSSMSRGTNRLIQEGAKLVANYGDILDELNLEPSDHQIVMREVALPTDSEARLMREVGLEPVHIDEICRSSGLPTSTVSSILTMMELKGLVKHVGGMNYTAAPGWR